MLYLSHLLLLQLEDGLQNRQQVYPLLRPGQGEELHDDILDILQVLDVFVSLLRPLVGPDLLLEDLGQLLQPRVVRLGLGQQRRHVPQLLLHAARAAGGGRADLVRNIVCSTVISQ